MSGGGGGGGFVASFLFAFLNDLKGFLTNNNVQGLKLPFEFAQDVSSRYRTQIVFIFIVVRGCTHRI